MPRRTKRNRCMFNLLEYSLRHGERRGVSPPVRTPPAGCRLYRQVVVSTGRLSSLPAGCRLYRQVVVSTGRLSSLPAGCRLYRQVVVSTGGLTPRRSPAAFYFFGYGGGGGRSFSFVFSSFEHFLDRPVELLVDAGVFAGRVVVHHDVGSTPYALDDPRSCRRRRSARTPAD